MLCSPPSFCFFCINYTCHSIILYQCTNSLVHSVFILDVYILLLKLKTYKNFRRLSLSSLLPTHCHFLAFQPLVVLFYIYPKPPRWTHMFTQFFAYHSSLHLLSFLWHHFPSPEVQISCRNFCIERLLIVLQC
jgi:hypothetical protein